MSTPEKPSSEATGKKKHRSPGYPVVSIGEAISRLRLIYQKDKRAFTTLSAILAHMGFKNTAGRSGRAGRVVSALKQYGLLDEKGGNFRVSDLGFKILYLPEDADERAQLIREAALNPPIFSKLLAYYKGEVPSNEALASHLVFREKFNPDTVDDFIRVFREIIEIAKPSPEDYNIGDESEGDELSFTDMTQQQPPPFTGQPSREAQRRFSSGRPGGSQGQGELPTPPAGQLHFPLYLSKDQKAALYVPAEMSQQEYNLLKQQIQNSLLVMLATAVIAEVISPKQEEQEIPPEEFQEELDKL